MYQVTAGQDPHHLVSIANVSGVYLDSIFTHVSVSVYIIYFFPLLSWTKESGYNLVFLDILEVEILKWILIYENVPMLKQSKMIHKI